MLSGFRHRIEPISIACPTKGIKRNQSVTEIVEGWIDAGVAYGQETAKTKTLNLRISPRHRQRLRDLAESSGKTETQILEEWIEKTKEDSRGRAIEQAIALLIQSNQVT